VILRYEKMAEGLTEELRGRVGEHEAGEELTDESQGVYSYKAEDMGV